MMNIAYWCVLAAGVLPLLTVAMAKARGGCDNSDPRSWLERQSGFRKRADFAHRNHFEAFPFFAAAVIIAQQMHAPQARIDVLAVGFIAARVAFTLLYLADLATLRSVAWAAGYACVIGLFFAASGHL
jgi:uncharacterized MAPEG superfamily protein